MTSTSHAASLSQAVPATRQATRVRYGILALLFIITTINYADRAARGR